MPSAYQTKSASRAKGDIAEATTVGKLDYGDDENIGEFISAQMERSRGSREKLERQWTLNIAYFLGHQYLQYDPHRKSLFLPHQPRHRVRIVVNRLMPMVRRIIAGTLRQRPQWMVEPATSDIEDQIVSQLARDYLRDRWRFLDMDTKNIDLLKWRSTTGNVFARAFWDPFKGERFVADASELADRIPRDPEEQQELRRAARKRNRDLLGPEDAKQTTVFLGDVDIEVVSPFNIFPDPDATDLASAHYLIDERQKPIRDVSERYNIAPEELLGKDEPQGGAWRERQLRTIGPPGSGSTGLGGGSDVKQSTLVTLRTIWVRPSRSEPNGWWAVTCNHKVLRKARNQPGFPVFPWIHLQEIKAPGRFMGTCALEQSIPIQVAYNRARSQIIEQTNTISRPPWLIPRGSGIRDESFTGEPGERVKYTWPLKPELAVVRDLPSTSHQNVHQLVSDLEDVSTQHEASRGIAPGRVESGVAVAQLQEQDEGILAPAAAEAAKGLGDLGSMVLKIASQMVTEERLIKIMGEENLLDVRYFKGKNLLGQNSGTAGVNYYDVRVNIGANLPISPAQRRQFATELAQFGILNPAIKEQREKLLELLELNRDPSSVSVGQLDKANQRRENAEMMASGQPSPIWPYDDDELHIAEARGFQKTPEYWRTVMETGGAEMSQIHQAFEQHLAAHSQRLEQRYLATAPQQPAGPGQQQRAPAQPPGPQE